MSLWSRRCSAPTLCGHADVQHRRSAIMRITCISQAFISNTKWGCGYTTSLFSALCCTVCHTRKQVRAPAPLLGLCLPMCQAGHRAPSAAPLVCCANDATAICKSEHKRLLTLSVRCALECTTQTDSTVCSLWGRRKIKHVLAPPSRMFAVQSSVGHLHLQGATPKCAPIERNQSKVCKFRRTVHEEALSSEDSLSRVIHDVRNVHG